jgi:hypothetical protein
MNAKTGKSINPLDYPICLTQPLMLDGISAWIEHIPFGMFMIDALRPKILVELGTHTGVSYSAFCQAVKQLGLDTRCYAIDTWAGDVQAGFYGTDILADLRAHHDPLYGHFSQLLQSTFDDAAQYFSNGSIDLLHIDGLHTYDAVAHDFATWLPKLSPRAIILFHDTNVRERDFGVWKFWEEIRSKYPNFEFLHGHGLGVLCVGSESSTLALEPFFTASADECKNIREFFFTLGLRFSASLESQRDSQRLISDKEQLTQRLTVREKEVKVLMAQVADQKVEINRLAAEVKAQEAEKKKAQQQLNKVLNNRVVKAIYQFASSLSLMLQIYRLENSDLFDKKWYLANNPDVSAAKMDPTRHYLLFGGFEGRNPGPNFSSAWYLNTYTDVKDAGINPLIHYIQSGKKEGRKAQSPPPKNTIN